MDNTQEETIDANIQKSLKYHECICLSVHEPCLYKMNTKGNSLAMSSWSLGLVGLCCGLYPNHLSICGNGSVEEQERID